MLVWKGVKSLNAAQCAAQMLKSPVGVGWIWPPPACFPSLRVKAFGTMALNTWMVGTNLFENAFPKKFSELPDKRLVRPQNDGFFLETKRQTSGRAFCTWESQGPPFWSYRHSCNVFMMARWTFLYQSEPQSDHVDRKTARQGCRWINWSERPRWTSLKRRETSLASCPWRHWNVAKMSLNIAGHEQLW